MGSQPFSLSDKLLVAARIASSPVGLFLGLADDLQLRGPWLAIAVDTSHSSENAHILTKADMQGHGVSHLVWVSGCRIKDDLACVVKANLKFHLCLVGPSYQCFLYTD